MIVLLKMGKEGPTIEESVGIINVENLCILNERGTHS